jgi:hypothetical protein
MRGELAHGRIGVHYPRQNVAPRGIGERPEQLVQNVRRRWPSIYNHLVVDSSTPWPAAHRLNTKTGITRARSVRGRPAPRTGNDDLQGLVFGILEGRKVGGRVKENRAQVVQRRCG